MQSRKVMLFSSEEIYLMEKFISPDQREQCQPAAATVSFFVDGEKKTYSGYEVGIIERATVSAIQRGFDDPGTLAYFLEAFNLADHQAAHLAGFLTGIDSTKISNRIVHSPQGNKGLYGGQPLAGLYLRLNQIFSADEPLHYLRASVNARTARVRGDRSESPLVSRTDALYGRRGIQEEKLLHEDPKWWGAGKPKGKAFDVADRVANGFAGDGNGLIGSTTMEPAFNLESEDWDWIVEQLNKGDRRDKRVAGAVQTRRGRKSAPNGADADYQFLRREIKKPRSRLRPLIGEVLTQKAKETCSPKIIGESVGMFLKDPIRHYALNAGKIWTFALHNDSPLYK
jgi:hypothetical protein